MELDAEQIEPQSPELLNLAEELEASELDDIGRKVFEDFENDLESRSEWETMHAEWMDLYFQRDVSENPPWNDSSQESIPILAEAVNQFQSRSYRAFFPNRYFVDCLPIGEPSTEARERAERISRHMSWQLGVLDRTYKPNKNQMFMAVGLHGSDFTKTYWSPVSRRTEIERVRALDLVVPYGVGPRRIEDVERKTQVKWMTLNDGAILAASGWFVVAPEAFSQVDSNAMQESADDADGLSSGVTWRDNNLCCVLEQHGILDLDNDGIGEPYIIWVDRQSQKVLRIQIRYEVDETGLPLDNKEPIEYFTHYQFLPNPDGFYGLGFGHLLGHMNKAANKLQRMFIDANELSVIGNLSYLISEQLGLKGDSFELSMGKGTKIPRSVDDINKHFKQLRFEPPSQQTLQMLQQITEASQRLSSSTDILAGQPDKVYQPTAMLAMIEQGLQLFSSVQEFLGVAMEDELQKIYRLNAKYLEEGAYFSFGDKQLQIAPEDYTDDFRVVPVFDPKYSTRSAKLAKAEAEYKFIIENPLTSQDPEAIYLASYNYLQALDTENIDAVLKKPAPPPQAVRIDDQNLENAYFLMPPDKRPLFDVFPDQDHMRHIKTVDMFITFLDGAEPMNIPNVPGGDPSISRLLGTMGDDQKKELIANLLRHRSLHLGYMYAQMNGTMDAQGQPIGEMNGNAGTETGSGLGEQGGDEAGLAEIINGLQAFGLTEDMQS